MALSSTNYSPTTLQSTNWTKNSSLGTPVLANSTVIKANSSTVLATGYTTLGNQIENILSTNISPYSMKSTNYSPLY